MGRQSRDTSEQSDVVMEDPSENREEPPSRQSRSRSSRRAASLGTKSYQEGGKTDEEDESDAEIDESSSEEEDEVPVRRRQPSRNASSNKSGKAKAKKGSEEDNLGKRRSGRSNKYKASMKVPGESVRDLYLLDTHDDDNNNNYRESRTKKRQPPATAKSKSTKTSSSPKSPPKTRGRHNTKRRQSSAKSILEVRGDDSDASMEDEYSEAEESIQEEELEDDETMKIQRILAVRSETRKKWREICASMQSSEVTNGSRWHQPEEDDETMNDEEREKTDSILEERYLVKWNQLSYLHVSWETHGDLMEQVENAKNYMSTFFRKQDGGLLFTQDERKDGDYFDPGLVQIDRILDVVAPEDYPKSKLPKTWIEEMEIEDPVEEFGIVLDNKTDPHAFDANAGRQFLIKWSSLNYADASYEFERDLYLVDQKDLLKEKLKDYYERTKKPSRKELSALSKEAEDARRRSYLFLGDNSRLSTEEKEAKVKEYQASLTEHVFRNGGSLRDYQAEGVTWFLSNYVNKRSCILADEMGLGKTLQTAAFCNLLVSRMHKTGPFLICVPLSTLAHWQREFIGWTDLNTIVYHGSAEDRKEIREKEFAYFKDRPDKAGGGINSLYLKKCEPSRRPSLAKWMVTVVVTTPEMLVADDWAELSFVQWQVLVVDEAHRLKNQNSKLALTMKKEQFKFEHKILLTGTPIQNDVKEFWTLLNFIDPERYDDLEEFMGEYGDMKSKEKIDELHEQIRPYILRRLKEDVEKSVPPKEETLIEVELTLAQKQYYRALYEKNVGFLHKNKKKALDGPSLNNLAMQLRKCCNHLFLLNGVEDDMRAKEGGSINEGDFVTNGSGKLVLLDKLLPRLKEGGHRILIFSQFKIMLDILEDYLQNRNFTFERIDGSITGNKRQSAIDRFQQTTKAQNPPFVMLLSTRAGGVGINLTAADTCVIFDSDWNPQNDIQAMARCHRIGQTKSVKVYRLLTRKTYEMQMFHMSSLKMGLDQAVLTGFESGSSGEGAMTKEEVERLLRHGAYDIFNEDKAGSSEAESKDFIEQDIDSILSRRSRKIVHGNTGSGSAAAGGTFSKASFVSKTPSKGNAGTDVNIDINDPDFWSKMVGEAKPEEQSILKPRRRNQAIYNEKSWDKNLQKALRYGESQSDTDFSESEDDDDDESAEGDVQERTRWGGPKPEHWKRDQVESVLALIEKRGYGVTSWENFMDELPKGFTKFPEKEIRRMAWSLILLSICETASSQGSAEAKRVKFRAEKRRDGDGNGDGDKSLLEKTGEMDAALKPSRDLQDNAFERLWGHHCDWAEVALSDAISFARDHDPRVENQDDSQDRKIRDIFRTQLWPSLQGRGWKVIDEDDEDGMEVYIFEKRKFSSPSVVMNEVIRIHPELQKHAVELLNKIEQSRLHADQLNEEEKQKDLSLKRDTVNLSSMKSFLERYSPKQILHDRTRKANRIPLRQSLLRACLFVKAASEIVAKVDDSVNEESLSDEDKLCHIIGVDARSGLPHPLWNRRHDAILIRSVAKHGWVDVDSNLKDIVNDKDIKWGYPFESSRSAPVQRIGDQEMKNIRETAERAASILNEKAKILNVLSGFNKNLVIDSYGLTQQEGNDEIEVDKKVWRVDRNRLHQASKKSEILDESVDLPSKKDFVKRAKFVIQKIIPKLEAKGRADKPASSTTKVADEEGKTDENNGYVVIDQSNRCNILLAEMIRALVKGSTKVASQVRIMWQMSHSEASALEEMYHSQRDKEKDREDLKRIMDQIALSKWASAKRSMTQGKNVLRVMLGEKPQVPRNDSIAAKIFPVEKSAPTPGNRMKAPAKRKTKKLDPPLGEKALRRAMKKAHDHNSGKAFGFMKVKDDLGIQLTMIESYILAVFCNEGMPLNFDIETLNSDFGGKTWTNVAECLIEMARQQYEHAKDVAAYSKAALTKGASQNLDEKQAKSLAENLAKAESDLSIKEEAARLAADFVHKPNERLSKKSIMLMEKVRAYGTTKASSSKGTNKYENYLGPKILKWFGKELARTAAQHDILDDENKPQSWTTADISDTIQNNPDYNKSVVSALLDKTSARQITSQIALLSRLRSILLQYSEKDFRAKLMRAIKQSKRTDDEWEKKPEWWDDSTDTHSFLLLTKLNEYGYTRIMAASKARDGFGAPDEDYEDMVELKLTKPSIQIRANQLVRELHAIEDHESMLKMVAKRRKSSNALDSLAVMTNRTLKKSSPTNSLSSIGNLSTSNNSVNGNGHSKRNTVQTGLKAFFSATPSKGRTAQSDSIIKSEGMGSGNNKRKDSPSPLDAAIDSASRSAESPPAEKKLKASLEEQSSIDIVVVD